MEKLKVLITSPSLDTSRNVGGISNLTRLIIENDNDIDFTHFRVGKEDSKKRNINWFFSQFILLYKFKRQIKSDQIKIAHINYPLSQLSIIINFLLIIISKATGTKTIIHLRGGELSLNTKVHFYQKLIITKSINLSDKVIVLGEKEKLFMTEFYKLSITNIVVLQNSVLVPDFKEIEKKNASRLKNNTITKILFLGRIDKDKGLNEILSAFKSINEDLKFTFFLAGTGPDKDWFITECKKVLGEKFYYLGILAYDEKIKVLRNSDIFILPSYFEGLPNALLESMSYGLVPVVTAVGSIPEVIDDNVDGFLIKTHDANDLINKMEMLISDIDLVNQISTNSYRKIAATYSILEYIQKLNNIYVSLIVTK